MAIPLKLLLALVLGALIGLERESSDHEVKLHLPKSQHLIGSLGVRTVSLISLLGAIAGLAVNAYFSLFLIISIGFMSLLIAYYILQSLITKDTGFTTEIAMVFSYLIGLFISAEIFPLQLIIALSVVLISVLSKKQYIKTFISGISRTEINAFISFAIIALVILPFLPNQSFALADIPNLATFLNQMNLHLGQILHLELLNPFKLWLIVALITGVDILGYVMERTIGQKKGWLLTSIAGGFISSTATTQSLAQKSQKSRLNNLLVAAAVFANLASFFQIGILLVSINVQLFSKSLLFLLAIIISGFTTGWYFFRSKQLAADENLPETKKQLQKHQIITLNVALKFTLLFLLINIASKIGLTYFDSNGLLLATALGAITGLDAVTINIADLAGKNIGFETAVAALILANTINLLVKAIYAHTQGDKHFSTKFALSMAIIIAASLMGLLAFI